MESECDSSVESTPSFCRSVSSASSSFSNKSQDDINIQSLNDSPIFMDLEFNALTKAFLSPLRKMVLFDENANIPVARLSPKRSQTRITVVDSSELICSPPVGTPFAVVEVVNDIDFKNDVVKSPRVIIKSANSSWIKLFTIFAFYLMMVAVSYHSTLMNFNNNNNDNNSNPAAATEGNVFYWSGDQTIENTVAIYQGFDHPPTHTRTTNYNQYIKPAPVLLRRLKATSRLVNKESIDKAFLEQALKPCQPSFKNNNTRAVYIIKPFTLRVTGKVSSSFQTGFREMSLRLINHLKIYFKTISSELMHCMSDNIKSFWSQHVAPAVEAKKMKFYGEMWFQRSRKVAKI